MRLSMFRRPLLTLCAALILPMAACGDDSTPGADTTDTTQPDTDTAQPDTEVNQPDTFDTIQPDVDDTAQPDTDDTVQPDTDDTVQPDTDDTAQPDTDTAQPDTDDTTQPDTDDTTQPDTDTTPTTATLAELLTPFANSANNFETAPNAKVTGLVVTLVKPDVGTELGGFFVQDPADQKAIYFAPATGVAALPAELEETSIIEVTIGKIKNVSGMPMVTEYSGLTITGAVESLDEAFQDATDWEVADWAGKQSTYIEMAGMIVGSAVPAGGSVAGAGGYQRFGVVSDGIEASTSSVNIRFPTELINYFAIENGCEFELEAGTVWAFRSDAAGAAIQYQPMFFAPWSFAFLLCTPPVLSNAVSTNSTTVVLTFSRPMYPNSMDIASFTFDPPLDVTAAVISDDLKTVTLTTAEQTAASYTVTVADDAFDTTYEPINPTERSFTFVTGEVAPTVIAGWNFGTDAATFTLGANSGITSNLGRNFTVGGGVLIPTTGTPPGSAAGHPATPSLAANTNTWNAGANTKYWQVTISTSGYQEVKVLSAYQRSSNTGPRDFKVQYSLDGVTFTDIEGTTYAVPAETFFSAPTFTLPSATDNQDSVTLRWLVTSTTEARGGASPIASGGTHRVDDIVIVGTPLP